MVSCISNDDIKLIFYICSRYNSQVPKYIKKNINFTCIILIYLERLWDLLKALTFHLQKYPTMLLNKYICSGVSRISFRGGGDSKYFWKSRGICMARSSMQRVAKSRIFYRVVRGHAPSKKILKWCNLVRFGEHFAKFCKKKKL